MAATLPDDALSDVTRDASRALGVTMSAAAAAAAAAATGNVTSLQAGLERIEHAEVWTAAVTQRVTTLALLIAFTLLGNVAIITVLTCNKYRRLQSRVNIFIVNLAVGDLTVCCVTMTTEVVFVAFEEAWVLGAVACKLLLYAQIVTLASTTFILTAMSIDRYLAICCPLRFGTRSSRARRMVALAWAAAGVFALPQLFIFKQVEVGVYPDGDVKHLCLSRGYTGWWQRKLYFSFMAAYILVVPTCIISFCYINVVRVVWRQGRDVIAVAPSPSAINGGRACPSSGSDTAEQLRKSAPAANRRVPRAKVRSVKMTLSIIVTFIACWTPYFVVHLVHIWSEYDAEIPASVYVFAETAALLNSALNPLIYGCFNIKMRSGLLEVFCPQRAKRPTTVLGHSSGGGGAGAATGVDYRSTECSMLIETRRLRRGLANRCDSSPLQAQRWKAGHGSSLLAPTSQCQHRALKSMRSAPEKLEHQTTTM